MYVYIYIYKDSGHNGAASVAESLLDKDHAFELKAFSLSPDNLKPIAEEERRIEEEEKKVREEKERIAKQLAEGKVSPSHFNSDSSAYSSVEI